MFRAEQQADDTHHEDDVRGGWRERRRELPREQDDTEVVGCVEDVDHAPTHAKPAIDTELSVSASIQPCAW